MDRGHLHMMSDVFWAFLTYLPTYPNQILYHISLFIKIRCILTYLPKNLTSFVNAPIFNDTKFQTQIYNF